MNVKLSPFNGNVSIEEYLDWVSEVEKFFHYMGTTDDKQVCLVAYKLKRGVSILVGSWWRMKSLPPDYQQELFKQYQDCRQGIRIVNKYMEDFDRLANPNDLEETKDQ